MKALNVIVAVIAVAALIGDLIFIFVLFNLGDAASAFSDLAATELSSPEIQEIGKTFAFAVNMGWAWAILVLVTALFAIKFAVFDARKK